MYRRHWRSKDTQHLKTYYVHVAKCESVWWEIHILTMSKLCSIESRLIWWKQMQQRQLMHHNIENKCADHKLISTLSCHVFTTVFHCLCLHSSKDFVQLVACLLYVIGFPSVIVLMKANFTILKIFYKGTKRRVYSILYISLKPAYSVDIHLLIERLLTSAGTTCFTGKPTRLSSFPITRNYNKEQIKTQIDKTSINGSF